ncbi:hypothetical protein BsWGS_22280 [Bradybaena similaris]
MAAARVVLVVSNKPQRKRKGCAFTCDPKIADPWRLPNINRYGLLSCPTVEDTASCPARIKLHSRLAKLHF